MHTHEYSRPTVVNTKISGPHGRPHNSGYCIRRFYGTLFYEKRPGMAFEMLSNASVYDVHKNVGGLEISYAGENLRKAGQILRLLTFRIANTGQTNITKGDFDDTEPLGFQVQGGRILETPKISGSNDYLRRHLSRLALAGWTGKDQDPIIFEMGDFIEAQALVLAPEGTIPTINPMGKISGIKSMQVKAPNDPKDGRSPMGSTYQRGFTMDPIRPRPTLQCFNCAIACKYCAIDCRPHAAFRENIRIPPQTQGRIKSGNTAKEGHCLLQKISY